MNNGQVAIIEEFEQTMDRIKTYSKSVHWCRNFFGDDDDVMLDAKDALYFSIMDLRNLMERANEVGIDATVLLATHLKVDEDVMERLMRS